jgi:7-keto-8-aminopelargonate synthetase-like enzyme
MSGRCPDLAAYREVAARHGATLYVDDAHGFGVLGEGPTADNPYGRRGNGVVRHQGLDYGGIVYIAGLSKAYSSMGAFVTCAGEAERRRFERASTMVFSGPVPVASLASALAGLRVNEERGDQLRSRLLASTRQLVAAMNDMGFDVEAPIGFPIVTTVIGGTDEVKRACQVLWDAGVLLTPAVFPAAPLDQGGVRLTLTAAHDDADLDAVIDALDALRARTRA